MIMGKDMQESYNACLLMTVFALVQLKEVEGYEPGQQLNPDEIFNVGEMVDVAGTSNGKGFQGECPPVPACSLPDSRTLSQWQKLGMLCCTVAWLGTDTLSMHCTMFHSV